MIIIYIYDCGILFLYIIIIGAVALVRVDDGINNIVENLELSIDNESSIDIVNEKFTNIETKEAESLICPSCGAKLVLRKARRGEHVGEEFYGCSNYPKCKYIRKIEMNSEKNE